MEDGDLIERELGSHKIFTGRIINLRVDEVALPNGKIGEREYVEHRGGASVLAVDAEENVYLVRQYRYPYREILLELPAGKLENGELPIETARRELEEETGFVGDIEPYGVIYPTPGYTNERLYVFIAKNLSPTCAHLDEDELLEVVKMSFEEALGMVLGGEIKDAKTCYAVLRYASERKKL